MTRSFKILMTIIALVLLFLIIFVTTGSQFYTDWLWFKNLGFARTFLTMFFSNFILRILVGLIFTLFIYINLLFTKKPLLTYINIRNREEVESLFTAEREKLTSWLNPKRLNYLYLLASIILGFLFSSVSQDLWKTVLNYFNQSPFNIADPIFAKDVSFYVFSLPFYSFVREMGMVLVILTLIVLGVIYTIASGISSLSEMKFKLSTRAKGHISVLLALFLFLKAWGYKLNMYGLLYSPRGVVFGAGYTDIHANLLGLRILFYIALFVGIIILVNIFKKSYRILFWALGIWVLTAIIFGNVYPAFVQRFQVEPNEIVKEKTYIEHHIQMTLKAYGLDKVQENAFNIQDELNPQVLVDNKATLNNIRLWDARPLKATYNQLQGLRPYYTFENVDIDRYYLDGEYRQVMLAARELDQNKLSSQAQTWINQTLKYTHGYGLAMSPVNKVTSEGLPNFYIKDIPPIVSVPLELTNPRIYYGEKTDNYVIVNNLSGEFDYPQGSENVYYNYQGTGGIPLDNFFKKLLYTVRFGNLKLLLSNDISSESRIMYYRNIKERLNKVAPFLSFDADPYLVVSQGRLFWIQDAYTTSAAFPYAQPISNLNYIRNSIKVLIDAYNGSMSFYLFDKNDPLALTYQKIFPDLFVPAEDMPLDIRQHLRYPQDLFRIQAEIYRSYHMKDPVVFYNKEDLWDIPTETYADNSVQVMPYYVIMQLPGNNTDEFLLMLPFTPNNKNNMLAWLAARCDGEHYGELVVYNFPKDKLVYGPMQIESRIDQDSEISQLLTLWGQRGSRVIRGNLLVIPVANSILYVEPIYLQAETSQLPELKMVVVSYQDQVVMSESFDQALNTIFKINGAQKEVVDELAETDTASDLIMNGDQEELITQALDLYQRAQASLREGDWASYGQLIEELGAVLERLNQE